MPCAVSRSNHSRGRLPHGCGISNSFIVQSSYPLNIKYPSFNRNCSDSDSVGRTSSRCILKSSKTCRLEKEKKKQFTRPDFKCVLLLFSIISIRLVCSIFSVSLKFIFFSRREQTFAAGSPSPRHSFTATRPWFALCAHGVVFRRLANHYSRFLQPVLSWSCCAILTVNDNLISAMGPLEVLPGSHVYHMAPETDLIQLTIPKGAVVLMVCSCRQLV